MVIARRTGVTEGMKPKAENLMRLLQHNVPPCLTQMMSGYPSACFILVSCSSEESG
jgi:hypothetical protein